MRLKSQIVSRLSIFILISLLLFAGCSINTPESSTLNNSTLDDNALTQNDTSTDRTEYIYDYAGENANWSAKYSGRTVNDFYSENGKLKCNTSQEGRLVLTYKDELNKLSSVREIGCEFNNAKGIHTFDQAPVTKTFSWGIEVNGPVEKTKNLKIIIDGKTEVIEMKSNE